MNNIRYDRKIAKLFLTLSVFFNIMWALGYAELLYLGFGILICLGSTTYLLLTMEPKIKQTILEEFY